MYTVATLSIKAEMMPAKRDINIVVHITLGERLRMWSAMRFGILD